MQTNINIIHTEDGTTEIQWGRAELDGEIHGYVQLHPDGRLTFPFNRDVDDQPLMLVIGERDGTVRIYNTEDSPPSATDALVFDSNNLTIPEES